MKMEDWQSGGKKKSWGIFKSRRERESVGDIETVRANELDLLETWHSAHGARSISLLCRRAG